jgi:integrase
MAHVYKRGKTWAVRFSKRHRRWDPKRQKMVSILTQRQKGGFHTKAEATKYGVEMDAAALSGVDLTVDPVFADYYKDWFEVYKFPSIKEPTKVVYRRNFKAIYNFFGETHIKAIDRRQYQKFINWFGKDHAKITVRKVNTSISSCVQYAIDDGILQKNFTHRVSISGNVKKERPVQYLNLNEIKTLVKLCEDGLQPRYVSRYLILSAIYTGARLGELSALHWKDIDFDKKTIKISKSWNQDRKEMSSTKTKTSNRTIVVNSSILDILKQLKHNNLEFVFGLPQTELPPTSNAANKTLRELLAKKGIKKKNFHFHSLRHSHVAYLLSQGVDIYAISKRLGHADLSITLNTYAYLLDEFKNKENDKIIQSLNKLD